MGNYPHYDNIVSGKSLNEEEFNKYVEQKMNEEAFILEVFPNFLKRGVEDWELSGEQS